MFNLSYQSNVNISMTNDTSHSRETRGGRKDENRVQRRKGRKKRRERERQAKYNVIYMRYVRLVLNK